MVVDLLLSLELMLFCFGKQERVESAGESVAHVVGFEWWHGEGGGDLLTKGLVVAPLLLSHCHWHVLVASSTFPFSSPAL